MITYNELRDLYLEELSIPFDGKAKVHNIDHWKNIEPLFLENEQRVLDVYDSSYNIYCWSDIHWGHRNIIKYCNRPYDSVEHMNQSLIDNYLNVVQPHDVVIFGGDIGFGKEEYINEILKQLPGYKILIIGNHDMTSKGKLHNYAFSEQHLCLPLNVGDFQLLFTHYPLSSVPNRCVNVHGHLHDKLANSWNINICVEHTNYAPINIKDIIKKAKNFLNI